MKLFLRIVCVVFLVSRTLTQDLGFDLADALDDNTPPKATKPPQKNDGFELDLSDALGGGDPVTPKPPVVMPPNNGGGGGGGGGGGFGDSDLLDVSQGGYEPEGGNSGGPGMDPGYDPNSGADQTQDPDVVWGQILKMLNANVPEELFLWMSNVKQMLTPLFERVLDLLNALP